MALNPAPEANEDDALAAARSSVIAERDRFLALAFCWAELLFELDPEGEVVFAAGAAEALTGRTTDELVGRPMASLVAQDDRLVVHSLLEAPAHRHRIDNVALRLLRKRGPTRPMVVAGYKLEERKGHFFLALRRPSALRPETGSRPLLRDAVSGLYDAGSLAALVSGGLETGRLAGRKMTFLAADGTAEVRDRFAEKTDVVAAIGALLRATSFNGDAAGRFASDRFALIHDAEIDVGGLMQKLERMVNPASTEREGITIHSVTLEIDNEPLEDHDVAKALVYTINRFGHLHPAALPLTSFSAKFSAFAKEAVDTVVSFRRAIAEDDFDIAFQPILDVRTGRIHHYEALARLRSVTSSRTPYEHITFAEETGLIAEFDLAMARAVISWLARTPLRDNERTCIAVNISGASVGSMAYLSELDALLYENAWARGRLMFEITESARMEQLGPANSFIQRLRQDGYPVCLDDFGAGAANFEYLSQLEVDIVKLDGTAIRNARRGYKGRAFLRALVSLCRELNVATIAEMIEDRSALDFVRECGVQFVQGHLFGEPSADIRKFADSIPAELFD